MLDTYKITEIYYQIDEFHKKYVQTLEASTIKSPKLRNRKFRMSDSEIMCILILFHLSGYRCLKHFYLRHVQVHLKDLFPNLVSYNRFVELQSKVAVALTCFLKTCQLGECTGITFVDSTTIKVCRNQRIHNHAVFKDIAERGKSSMGWFYGFKLHLICNEKGEILNFTFTIGNVDDRKPLIATNLLRGVFGKLFGDKGYIGEKLFKELFFNGIHLVTTVKRNMKERYRTLNDRIILRKRAIIETINDELKNSCQIEHTRHRSFNNFIMNALSAISAYCFLPKKPAIKVEFERQPQYSLF